MFDLLFGWKDQKSICTLHDLLKCLLIITTLDLWMSKGVYDDVAFVMNVIGVDWKPKHVRIVLFKAIKISGQVHLTLKIQSLLDEYGLRKKILEYV